MKRFYLFFLSLPVIFSACNTTVTIRTTPPNVDVYLKGRYYGKSPTTINSLSNSLDEDYYIEFKAGDKILRGAYLEKELKMLPLIGGCFCLVPWFWVYGPEPDQHFNLEREYADIVGTENTDTGIRGFGDTVILKDGTTYRNVSTAILKERIIITKQNGQTIVLEKQKVKSLGKGK